MSLRKKSTFDRVRAWSHWVKLEKPPADVDRLLMANDMERLLAVVEKSEDLIKDDGIYDPSELELALDAVRIEE